MAVELKVTLVRSTIGVIPKHKKTIEALGLRKINSTKVHKDNGAMRGMLRKVSHLVKVEEI
jgi:large subunit ribosomal protein L30